MKKSVKIALATSVLAVGGGVFLASTGFAERFGPGGHMGMMHGFGGPIAHEMLGNVDTNKDGALSQDEINATINARFAEFDADKNGSLSLQEFEALWAEITKPMAVRAFQFLDPNGDASVAKTEIDDRFGKLVSRFDRNEDGMLSHDDRPRRGMHGRWHGPWRDGGDDDRPADE